MDGRDADSRYSNSDGNGAQVVAADSERMGKIIDHLAAEMLTPGIDASWPSKVLLSIDDARVVPYFVKALETRSYSRKFDATCALAKYPTDEAVAALAKALSTGRPRH